MSAEGAEAGDIRIKTGAGSGTEASSSTSDGHPVDQLRFDTGKVAVIGATGKIGFRVVMHAVKRKLKVRALVRSRAKFREMLKAEGCAKLLKRGPGEGSTGSQSSHATNVTPTGDAPVLNPPITVVEGDATDPDDIKKLLEPELQLLSPANGMKGGVSPTNQGSNLMIHAVISCVVAKSGEPPMIAKVTEALVDRIIKADPSRLTKRLIVLSALGCNGSKRQMEKTMGCCFAKVQKPLLLAPRYKDLEAAENICFAADPQEVSIQVVRAPVLLPDPVLKTYEAFDQIAIPKWRKPRISLSDAALCLLDLSIAHPPSTAPVTVFPAGPRAPGSDEDGLTSS